MKDTNTFILGMYKFFFPLGGGGGAKIQVSYLRCLLTVLTLVHRQILYHIIGN